MNSLMRPMPSETVKGLTPPLAGFPYFAEADRFRFQPRASAFSPLNAWWLADASFLVYGDADFVEQTLQQTPLPGLGFELKWIGDRENNNGMILVADEVMAVIFRGTRLRQRSVLDAAELVLIDQDDLWTDSRFIPTACSMGGEVHHGFLSRYAEFSDALDAEVAAKSDSQAALADWP